MKNIFEKLFQTKKVQISNQKNVQQADQPADFEAAIRAVGFGKFNVLLIFLSIPMCWTSIFETTSMSYVFPVAQCDLNLTLEYKGLLNAVTYAGTISSAFLWGFLYDTFGRRKPLIIGFLLDGVCAVLSGFAQNVYFLMFTKYMGGFMMNGPFAALTIYLSELHSANFRSRVPILTGLWTAIGNIFLPLFASFIMPMDLDFVFADYFVLHSWSFYLLFNSLPALISGLIFVYLPESPKYLMSMGRNEDALEVFRKIYSINSGNDPDLYPVMKLVDEPIAKERLASKSSIKNGWEQIRPLFLQPLLKLLILVCALQMCITMGLNTLRLWIPQLFQAIADYKLLNNGGSSSLCVMLSVLNPQSNSTEECFVNKDNFDVYSNSMIVSATTSLLYLLAGTFVNILGTKTLLTIVSFISGLSAAAIYFSSDGAMATALISAFISMASVGSNVIIIAAVDLFPTTSRALTVSLVMMAGRGAAMVGNIIFPYTLQMGCAPPFFGVSGVIFIACVLSLLLPQRNKNFI